MTIEDIILDNDRRGISSLRPFMPANFIEEAALLILDNPGTAIITTGFYILDAAAAETDGPPGAVAIGNALHELGYGVVYITDRFATSLMAKTGGEHARVVEFPIMDDDTSSQFASGLLAEIDPSIVISIERCGFTDEGLYRNMRGRDITAYNARIDHIFTVDCAQIDSLLHQRLLFFNRRQQVSALGLRQRRHQAVASPVRHAAQYQLRRPGHAWLLD